MVGRLGRQARQAGSSLTGTCLKEAKTIHRTTDLTQNHNNVDLETLKERLKRWDRWLVLTNTMLLIGAGAVIWR